MVLHQLLVEHVQQRLAGDVGDVVGAGRGGAAEGARAEQALLVAVEGDALVLEPEHLVRRLAAHDLDRVLVAEVVRALDGVERVRLPRVVRVQRGVDAAGGRVGVRSDGVDLAHDRHGRPGAGGRERGALAGEAGADDQHVVGGHGGGVYWRYGLETPRGPGAAIGAARRRCPSYWGTNMTHGLSQRPVRVLVVDDHADVRFLVRAILEDAAPDVAFAGEAATAREAVAAARGAATPTWSCSTPGCPPIDGFEAAAMLLERRPGLPILLCSAIVDDEIRERAAAAGIAACLSKDHFEAIPRVVVELRGADAERRWVGAGAPPGGRLRPPLTATGRRCALSGSLEPGVSRSGSAAGDVDAQQADPALYVPPGPPTTGRSHLPTQRR